MNVRKTAMLMSLLFATLWSANAADKKSTLSYYYFDG